MAFERFLGRTKAIIAPIRKALDAAGDFMASLMLGVLFIAVVTPLSLLQRAGRLGRKAKKKGWSAIQDAGTDLNQY